MDLIGPKLQARSLARHWLCAIGQAERPTAAGRLPFGDSLQIANVILANTLLFLYH